MLATTPHPDAWPQLPRRRLTPALRAHHSRRFSVDEVITRRRQPRLAVAPGIADAVETRIVSLVPQVMLVHQQRRRAEHQIDRRLMARWPTVMIPRCGPMPARRPSPSAAASARTSSTCGITGRASAFSMMFRRVRMTTHSARAVTGMRGRCAAWPTAGCAFSWPC